MKVTFILKNLTEQFFEGNGCSIVGLSSLSDEDKFKKLSKMCTGREYSDNCTMRIARGGFRDRVELNQMLRAPCTFEYKIERRRGYRLATFEISPAAAAAKQQAQHYSDLTLKALVERHGWHVACSGLQYPGRVDSVRREFDGVGPLGTLITPNGERRLIAGYHGDLERRRYIALKLGDGLICDADGRDRDPNEVAALINAQAEQYTDGERIKNGLAPLYGFGQAD